MYIKNLKIVINKDDRVIVDGLSFSLARGDKAVIIGEEGNGKSTLLKLIYDSKLIQEYAGFSGQISVDEKLAYLPQEMPRHYLEKTIYEFFLDNPAFTDTTPKELNAIAWQLGIDEDMYYSQQLVGTLSGGEKIKLQLAGIMLERPDVLLLDEPSNDIDVGTLYWLENFINDIPNPILFVSHDETLIENTANMIIHIEQIRRKTLPKVTVEHCDYETYKQIRLFNICRQEQQAQKEKDEFDKKMRRWREIYEKVDRDQRNISRGNPAGGRLLKKKMKLVKSQERRYEKEKENLTEFPDYEEAIITAFENVALPNGKVVLDLNLDKLTVADKVLANNVHLKVLGNTHLCIIGNNGVGKTTLIKRIWQELNQRTDLRISYMPQNYADNIDQSVTPIEYLSDGTKEGLTKARTYLGCMKYRADEMEHAITELSGGQKAKLLYLKMVLSGSNVLILDEPTRNFSPLSNPVIRSVLSKFGGAIISISHDRKFIDEVCDTVYEFTKDGLRLI